jgi:copper(I)-binding protein
MNTFSKLSGLTLPALALGLFASSAFAHDYKVGDLTIDHAWTRATPAGAKAAAGYLKITNHGKEADKLIGGSVQGVDKVEVHEMKMENNVMKMNEVKGGLEIKPGQTVELKPSSYHIMMIGLKSPIKKGDTVKGTLKFEKAGSVDVSYEAEAMGAKDGGMSMDHDHMGHQK